MRLGYFLSCEEFTPAELVAQAKLAEKAGFEALWISDHYHPWNGFDEVYVNQIGPDQEAFFGFYAENVLPRVRG